MERRASCIEYRAAFIIGLLLCGCGHGREDKAKVKLVYTASLDDAVRCSASQRYVYTKREKRGAKHGRTKKEKVGRKEGKRMTWREAGIVETSYSVQWKGTGCASTWKGFK